MSILTAMAQKDYKDELEVETSNTRLRRLRDEAKTKALITDIAWGATLVSGIVTTVLVVSNSGGSSETPETARRPIEIGIGPSGLVVDGRF